MRIFRWIAYSLPQVLIILILGGRFDLLFGLNHTETGFMLFITVALVSPVVVALLMSVELILYSYRQRDLNSRPSFRMPAISIILVIETLALDIYILSLVRM